MEPSPAKTFVVTIVVGVAAAVFVPALIWIIASAWHEPQPPAVQQVYCVTGPTAGFTPVVTTPEWCDGDDPGTELWVIDSRHTYDLFDDLTGPPTPRVLFKVASADQAERRRLGLPATGEVPNGPLARPVK